MLTDIVLIGQTVLPGSIQVGLGPTGTATTVDGRLGSIQPGTNTLVINLGKFRNPSGASADNTPPI